MKAAFINAGPLETGGPQQDALQELGSLVGEGVEILRLTLCHSGFDGELLSEIAVCDAWVFAFETPGGEAPENLIACLQILGRFFGLCPHRRITVYVLALDADGEHEKGGEAAVERLRAWCEETALCWGGSVGLSETALLFGGRALAPSMRRSVRHALETLAAGISGKAPVPMAGQFVSPDLPLFLRRLMRSGRKKPPVPPEIRPDSADHEPDEDKGEDAP